MTLEDVVANIEATGTDKILVEEFVGNGGALPTEFKFHMFNGGVSAIDVIANRGTGCDCYVVIDMACTRLDSNG
ncbi:MAG: hypothetical protein AAGJ35_16330 [Myxococcota bacterium]